jgi:hypothetical protein
MSHLDYAHDAETGAAPYACLVTTASAPNGPFLDRVGAADAVILARQTFERTLTKEPSSAFKGPLQ